MRIIVFLLTLLLTACSGAGSRTIVPVLPPVITVSCGGIPCTHGAFQQIPIGGQGEVPGIQIAPDGSMVARSDAAGPWWRQDHTQKWIPVVQYPGTNGFPNAASGAYFPGCDIAISTKSGTTNTLYMWYTINQNVAGGAAIYKSTDHGQHWTQTDSSFPAFDTCGPNGANRLWGPKIRVSPNNSSVVYVSTVADGVYYTTNAGTSWTALTAIPPSVISGQGTAATASSQSIVSSGSVSFISASGGCTNGMNDIGQIVEVASQANPNNIMVGTISACSGSNFTLTITRSYGSGSDTAWYVDTGFAGGGGVLEFDPSDATGNTIYIWSESHQGYKCTSATTTPSCSAISNTSGPSGPGSLPQVVKLVVDNSGTVWATDNSGNGGNRDQGQVYRLKGGTWTNQVSGLLATGNMTAIAVDPDNTCGGGAGNCVYLGISGGGCLVYSLNAQNATPTWNSRGSCASPSLGGTDWSWNSTVVPWLPWSNDNSLTASSFAFDPTQSHVMYAGVGDGVVHLAVPTTSTPGEYNWNADDTQGIENANNTYGVSVPGGGIYMTMQDRAAWLPPIKTYPHEYGPGNSAHGPNANFLRQGCYSNGVAMITDLSGLTTTINPGSIDTGATWNVAAQTGISGNPDYGNCVAESASTWVWDIGENTGPYVTANSGSSWTACTFGGGQTAGGGGWTDNYGIYLAQDASTPTTVLLYNDGSGSGNGSAAEGFYQSTSGCAFTKISNQVIMGNGSGGVNFTYFSLQQVPGNSGHFFASGLQSNHDSLPGSSVLYKTTNGGSGAWTQVASGTLESLLVWGFGAPKPGGDGYPVFYCICYVKVGGVFTFGLWESDNIDNATPTFTNIDSADNGFPGGNFDQPTFVQGDLATYGTVYVGFYNSGGMYRTLN